ncbi:hypothetical protein EV121DRAFT_192174 [Schizophyllum commune]
MIRATYGKKGNKKRQPRSQPTSSPMKATADAQEDITVAEMSRRMLKRSRSACNVSKPNAENELADSARKRLRNTNNIPSRPSSPKSDAYTQLSDAYTTPHPSILADSVKFKLKSSRGNAVTPDYFSPAPPARRALSRASSANLKENQSTTRRSRSRRDSILDSPFSSRPASRNTSPSKIPLAPKLSLGPSLSRSQPENASKPRPKKSLISQSTTTSPSRQDASSHIRRPSAPEPPRPSFANASLSSLDLPSAFPASLDHLGFEYGFGLGFSDPETLPLFQPRDIEIDFNRPPSQLSIYGLDYDSDDEFRPPGDGPQAVSTPAMTRTEHVFGGRLSALQNYRPSSPSAASSDDTIMSPSHGLAKSQSVPNLHAQNQPNFSMYQSPAYNQQSRQWSDDSLLSPPKFSDYGNRDEDPFARDAPMTNDVPMIDDEDEELDDMLGAFVAAPCPDEEDEDEVMPLFRQVHAEDTEAASQLKDMLDKMVLDDRQDTRRSLPLRTRSMEEAGRTSLGAPMELGPSVGRQGRDRRGTIRASDFLPSISAGRTRSGTIRPSENALPQRTRSGTVIGPAKGLPGSAKGVDAPLTSRKRSGTVMKIVQPAVVEEHAPAEESAAVQKPATANQVTASSRLTSPAPMDVDDDLEAVQDSGIGLGPSPMDSDDGLLLKSDDPIPGGVERLGRKASGDAGRVWSVQGRSEDSLSYW